MFKKCMRACCTIFGEKGFRLRKSPDKKHPGEWVGRVNASVFQVISTSFAHYDIGSVTRSADSIFEAFLDLISADKEWITAVTAGTGAFQRIEYSFKTWEERLRLILTTETPNDSSRLFSRALKEDFFDRDNTCRICGQKINMINDAALDHHQQYWKGGQTVPENARLVHRLCNLERSQK